MIDNNEVLAAVELFADHFDPNRDNAEFLWSFLRGECSHDIRENDHGRLEWGEEARGQCILCGDDKV